MASFVMAPGADPRAAMGVGEITAPPPLLAELRLSGEARVNAFELKAGFAQAENYYALDGTVGDDAHGRCSQMS